jgi:hypothetical protein
MLQLFMDFVISQKHVIIPTKIREGWLNELWWRRQVLASICWSILLLRHTPNALNKYKDAVTVCSCIWFNSSMHCIVLCTLRMLVALNFMVLYNVTSRVKITVYSPRALYEEWIQHGNNPQTSACIAKLQGYGTPMRE